MSSYFTQPAQIIKPKRNSGYQVHGSRFTVHGSRLIALLFSSYLLGNIDLAPDLCAIAPSVLQEPDELFIRFRIEPVFHQSNTCPLLGGWNPEPLNFEPEQFEDF